MTRRSLWLATTTDKEARPRLAGRLQVDVAVVGAGIFGTTAAYLLKREGLRVVLLEMRRVGTGTSGYTTAKLPAEKGKARKSKKQPLRVDEFTLVPA